MFGNLKVNGNSLHIYERYPSDVPRDEVDIDLSKIIK